MLVAPLRCHPNGTIATRLARTGASLGLFSPGHAGGIPHIGTTELLQATANTILNNAGRGTAMLVIDVKGAFNAVKTEPLLNAMKRLGVPETIKKWTKTFLENRTVTPRRLSSFRVFKLVYGCTQVS